MVLMQTTTYVYLNAGLLGKVAKQKTDQQPDIVKTTTIIYALSRLMFENVLPKAQNHVVKYLVLSTTQKYSLTVIFFFPFVLNNYVSIQ